MQKVKAHELRNKEDGALVEELAKFRVGCVRSDFVERAVAAESKQGFCSAPGKVLQDQSKAPSV